MEKKLGRGLESLIPVEDQQIRERVQSLKVSQIVPSRFQPRLTFSEAKIKELAQSIKEKGVIQPVIVRSAGNLDQYELIAGERRFRAVKSLGLLEIPAIVRRVSDADVLEMSIVENIQREELNAVEEAKAYRRLAQEFGLSQDNIAERVGKDKSTVSNLLRILNLPEKIQQHIQNDDISLGHAKALLAVIDPARQLSLCERAVREGLSVRQMEFLTLGKRPYFKGRSAKREAAAGDVNIRALEEKLRQSLGTKVRILHGRKRGKLEIEYYSLEDLDRILKRLGIPTV